MAISDAERLAILNDIRSEGQVSGFSEKVAGRRPKTPVYRLLNPSPNSTDEERAEFKPGIKIGEEVVNELKCVVLFVADGRRLKRKIDGKHQTTCMSFDGESPAPRIKEPECQKLTTEGLVNIISKFRGYDKAKIESKVKELTEDSPSLKFCSIKTARDFIPLCPKARFNEDAGVMGPCKAVVSLYAYDIKRKQVFRMELSGKSIRNDKKFQSPLASYRKFIGQQRVNYFSFVVTLAPVKDGGYYYLDFKDYMPIAKPENREEMKQLAVEQREGFERMVSWAPGQNAEVQAPVAPEVKESIDDGMNEVVAQEIAEEEQAEPEISDDDLF